MVQVFFCYLCFIFLKNKNNIDKSVQSDNVIFLDIFAYIPYISDHDVKRRVTVR